MGGSVRSATKTLAAKIRAARWASDRKKSAMDVVDCVVDADISAVEILRYLEQIKNDPNLTIDGRLKLLQVMIRAHEAIHGTRQKINAEITPKTPERTFDITKIMNELREEHIKKHGELKFDDEVLPSEN
ncbi:hypothetical protein C4580_02390 [Candidatus Woesearchaeota archaeon]|nr:MAG: hypothetical protein C4580_02390 [Candidatus Woesearchaeota archaeon]